MMRFGRKKQVIYQVMTKVTEVRMVAIRISKVGKERRERLLCECKCLVCETPVKRGHVSRGLCDACRALVRRMIERGERTEESFIREGKLVEMDDKCGGRIASEKRLALRKKTKATN